MPDCNCQGSKSTNQDHRNAFAERAMKLAMSLPDDVTCRKTYSEPEAQFLSALRDLAAGYALAHTWSEPEARVRFEALKFTDAAITYSSQMIAMRASGSGDTGESPTARCEREKRECRDRCDNDPDAGYFCYFDCRLAYLACLAGTIMHGYNGVGPVIA